MNDMYLIPMYFTQTNRDSDPDLNFSEHLNICSLYTLFKLNRRLADAEMTICTQTGAWWQFMLRGIPRGITWT